MNFAASLPFNTAGHGSHPFGRRHREPRGARRPVVLVAGFHGAGKTTLINRIIATSGTSAVVISEADDTATAGAIPAGCICCPSRGEMERVLADLVRDQASGRISPFDHVVIETAGGADPSPLMKSLLDERNLGRHFHLASVMAVVDAPTGAVTLRGSSTAQRQVAVADRIVVMRSALADEAALADLRGIVGGLNPSAPWIEDGDPDAAGDHLLRDGSLPFPRLDGPVLCETMTDEHVSFRLEFPDPLPWAAFAAAMSLLSDMRGADLLRVKGLIAIEGCAGPVVIQIVQNVAQKPLELERWPRDEAASELLFVTRGLAPATVKDLFDAVIALRKGTG
ncbi:CobW family GTP-binding protein [Ancylobacter terrae]|uniref:CobW family GTP-binding protein n=1 Tax=Ancylobacter sp. sgz301288 TaxID=3342077 RepID=UPI00385C976F